jgi:predicted GH43/DUF377 family glycosyl hydrolase
MAIAAQPLSSGENIECKRVFVMRANPDCPWASEMVLNPAVIEDPKSKRLHMLFRATGPFSNLQHAGQPAPYPISLGYAYSDDVGETWTIDFSKPCLFPALSQNLDEIYINSSQGKKVVNHANGCIEDPRLFFLDDECYMTVACRMFAPGPYWIKDDPIQCAPSWALTSEHPFGRAASENVTVTVLYKVDLASLSSGDYEGAFKYVCNLTDPFIGENRDVIVFPEKLSINGRKCYVALHRPWEISRYENLASEKKPSIVMCYSDTLEGLAYETASQEVLARPLFEWEGNRIGASGPLVKISDTEWLLSYHGKQDATVGYTQSFMILETRDGSMPQVIHRCSERVMFPVEDWEMPGRFKTPVIFITGMVTVKDRLLIAYGAADERVGIAWFSLSNVISFTRQFNAVGERA